MSYCRHDIIKIEERTKFFIDKSSKRKGVAAMVASFCMGKIKFKEGIA